MTKNGLNTLLIEDSAQDLELIHNAASELGLTVRTINIKDDLSTYMNLISFSLILINLSKGNDEVIALTKLIRKISDVPIIVILERDLAIDENQAIEAGANDYIFRPINTQILSLRINQHVSQFQGVRLIKEPVLKYRELILDSDLYEFWVNDQITPLTRTEFEIMRYFLAGPEQIFTRRQIISSVDLTDRGGVDHLLDTHLSRIRGKIRKAGGSDYLFAVRGVGIRLAHPVMSGSAFIQREAVAIQ
jgi:DNA-binding response OmpR family regulator